jgi:PAS domain S-box-containing protein
MCLRGGESVTPLSGPGDRLGELPRRCVLIVDDDEHIRTLLCRRLRQVGYSVLEAGDGEAALRLLEARGDVALVLTDVEMAGMGGWELARIAAGAYPQVPVLFMTGNRVAAAHLAATFSGAAVLLKPFQLDELLTAVALWIRPSAAAAELAAREPEALLQRMAALEQRIAELEESGTRFRILADTAPVMVWMSEPDKLCSFFGRGWLAFTGRSLEQELGDGWSDGVHPDDRDRCLATYVSAFEAREPFRIEYRLRRFDGEYRSVMDVGTPRRRPGGAFAGYVGSAVDVTGVGEPGQHGRALIDSIGAALVGDLTAALARQLDQPTAAIAANAHAALHELDRFDPDRGLVRQAVTDIAASVRRLRGLLQGIGTRGGAALRSALPPESSGPATRES